MDSTPIAFSLTRGGPFYLLLRKLGVVRLDARDPLRQAVAVAAVAWLPLQLLALLDSPAADPSRDMSFSALALHTRFLVAVPLLFVSERFAELRCDRAIESVANDDLGTGCSVEVRRFARAAERLRDSAAAELAILGLMLATRFGIWHSTGRVALVSDYNATGSSDLAALWHASASLPIFNFLLLRWLWRWLIWSVLLFRISRLSLRLCPAHPDRSGGLGRLADPAYAVAILVNGLSAFVAASWGTDIVSGRAELQTFALKITALVVGAELLAFVPLASFAVMLSRARFDGGDQYSRFALAYTRLFHTRWIDEAQREGLLGTPDLSGLADLISSVDRVDELRVVPFGRTHVLGVLAAVLAPLLPLPLLAANASLPDLVQRLLKVLLFGP